jgi:predicted metal-binding membrane protein
MRLNGLDAALLLGVIAAPPYRGPILIAAAGLLVTFADGGHAALPAFCGDLAIGGLDRSLPLLSVYIAPERLFVAWLAMIAAMMTPLIAIPLAHVRQSSLTSRRWRAASAFMTGYFGCWLLAGPLMLALSVLVQLSTGSAEAGLGASLLAALLWSASPFSKAAQNRAHRLRRIRLFGLAADYDSVSFGAKHGFWCLCSCWPWMLVMLTVQHGHAAAMILITAGILIERARGGGRPCWRWPPALALPIGWGKSGAARICGGRTGSLV